MDFRIDEVIDKGLYYKKLSNDKVINIIVDAEIDKSTLTNGYRNNEKYLVIDYDMILLNPNAGTIEYELKQMLIKKYGNSLFENTSKIGIDKVKENLTIMYSEIINYLSNQDKTIVLNGNQLSFINDPKTIKGEFVALRPSIQTCLSQSIQSFIKNNPQATVDQIQEYTQKRTNSLHQLIPIINELLTQVDMLPDIKNPNIYFDNTAIQSYLQEISKTYLLIIKNEYGAFMSQQQIQFLNQLIISNCVKVDLNGKEYLLNQSNDINNSPNLTTFEKLQALRKLNVPLGHGGRVFEDNIIHFYPSSLLYENPNLTTDELKQKCDEIMIHELLHFFIRPEKLDTTNMPELNGINGFTTEGLVDMCARDIQQKYDLNPNYNSEYGSNVIMMREMLANISDINQRNNLIFNGNIESIYENCRTAQYNPFSQYVETVNKKNDFLNLLHNISKISPNHQTSIEKNLLNLCANYQNKSEMINQLLKLGNPDQRKIVETMVCEYQEEIKTQDTTPLNEEIQNQNNIDEPSIFDKKEAQRVENQINFGNMTPDNKAMYETQKEAAKENETVKNNTKSDNVKVLQLTKNVGNNQNNNSGFIKLKQLFSIIVIIILGIVLSILILR